MANNYKQSFKRHERMGGFTLIEITLVVFVMSVLAAITVPNVMLTVSNVKLRGTAADLAGMMQQARIMAAKNNPQNPPAYAIKFAVLNGTQSAYVDLNGTGTWNGTAIVNGVSMSEPVIGFGGTVKPAPQPAAVDSRLRTSWWATAALVDRSPTPIPWHSRQEACRVITPPHRHAPLRRPVISFIT